MRPGGSRSWRRWRHWSPTAGAPPSEGGTRRLPRRRAPTSPRSTARAGRKREEAPRPACERDRRFSYSAHARTQTASGLERTHRGAALRSVRLHRGREAPRAVLPGRARPLSLVLPRTRSRVQSRVELFRGNEPDRHRAIPARGCDRPPPDVADGCRCGAPMALTWSVPVGLASVRRPRTKRRRCGSGGPTARGAQGSGPPQSGSALDPYRDQAPLQETGEAIPPGPERRRQTRRGAAEGPQRGISNVDDVWWLTGVSPRHLRSPVPRP